MLQAYEAYWNDISSKSLKNVKMNCTGNGHDNGLNIFLAGGDEPISVYSDVPQVLEYLRRPEFVLGKPTIHFSSDS